MHSAGDSESWHRGPRSSSAPDDAPRSAWRPIVGLGWLALGVIGLLAAPAWGGDGDYGPGQTIIATLGLLFGAWVFWTHGGRHVTAAGVYSLASGIFCGYAGLWWLNHQGDRFEPALFQATAIAYFVHVAMFILFWTRSDSHYRREPLPRGSAASSTWAVNLGLALVIGSAVISQVRPTSIAATVAFAGVVLLAAGLAVKPGGNRLPVGRLLLVVLALGLYVAAFFNGFGRLTVVGLGVAVTIVFATRARGRAVKLAVIAGAPIAVSFLTTIREDLANSASTPDMASSVESPLETFARLLSGSAFASGDGSTFWATATAWVPRSVWPEKPLGFGAVLTRILEPEMAASGHSMAALDLGEWFYNWRWAGLGAMVLVTGWLVRWLDRRAAAVFFGNFEQRRDLLALAAVAIVVGGLADLAWVGSFTYVTRIGVRLAVLLVIFLAVAWRTRQADAGATRTAVPPVSVKSSE
jgi:hypothetical protein